MSSTGIQSWMSPLDKIHFQRAIKARAETVTIDDGRRFKLEYAKREGKVLYYPDDGKMLSVPRGWLDISTVERKEGEWLVS